MMVSLGRVLCLVASLVATTISPVSAIEPIKYVQCPNSTIANTPVILQGKRFYKSDTGEYFPVKGIAYYPRPNQGDLSEYSSSVDFFTEEFRSLWEADIRHLKELGVNTVRIYAVNPSQNHDAFMCALQANNIYAIVGLLADCEGCAVGMDEAPSCYPPGLKTRGEWVINEFSKYANTLAFSAGNEVTLYAREWGQVSMNAGCQKKFLRDMRQYVETCSGVLNTILPRKVPIGMVNWDYERSLQTLYFNCQTDPTDLLETPEWYGLNSYQHCDPNDLLLGWVQLRQDFESYNLQVPVVVAEYGCRERGFPTMGQFEAQRTWQQVDALFNPTYSEVFAGGVVFEYSAEKRIVDNSEQGNPWPYYGFMKLQYGIGYYSPVDCDHTTIACAYNRYPEFEGLRERLAAVDVSFVPNMVDDNSQMGAIPQCPEGMPILSEFEWPSDQEDDLPCYVVATQPPTPAPTTAAPTFRPTTEEPSQSPTQSPTSEPTQSPTNAGEENIPTDEDNNESDEDTNEGGPTDLVTDPTEAVIPGISSSTHAFLASVLLATTGLLSLSMAF